MERVVRYSKSLYIVNIFFIQEFKTYWVCQDLKTLKKSDSSTVSEHCFVVWTLSRTNYWNKK